jgi:hypothetical protein
MTPLEAFQDTIGRAKRLLRMHDGLVNTRQRAIRSDWKANFCELMHWPQASDIERVDSKDAVVVLRHGASLTPDDFSGDAVSDLLRSAITFGVSAIDRYVHERIIKGFVAAFREQELTKQQKEFQVPATLAIEIVNRVHSARRDATVIRPANEIRKVVQEALHKRPFQSWREIEYGFCLLGCKDLGKELRENNNISPQDIDTLKSTLNKIVARRNQIVHEGDLPRHQRGGQVYVQEIRRAWVEESLTFLEDFTAKLEKV